MSKIDSMVEIMAKFTDYLGKHLPDDVMKNSGSCGKKRQGQLQRCSMTRCSKTWRKPRHSIGRAARTPVLFSSFPRGIELPHAGRCWKDILVEAVRKATRSAPLRHNAVETFLEKNTGDNTGLRLPWIDWDIVPNEKSITIDAYMAGGGCTLPGAARVSCRPLGMKGWSASFLT